MRRAVVEVFPSIRYIPILQKSAIIIADFFLDIFARLIDGKDASIVIIKTNFN